MRTSKTIELGIDKKVKATIANVEKTTIQGAPAVMFTVTIKGGTLFCHEFLNKDRTDKTLCFATATQNNGLVSFLRDNVDYDPLTAYSVLTAVDDILEITGEDAVGSAKKIYADVTRQGNGNEYIKPRNIFDNVVKD